MYDGILVPIDGSEQSSRALDHAVGHAETYDAAVHLLFVVDVASLPTEVDAAPVAERLDSYGERITAGAADRVEAAGVDRVETAVVPGVPHRAVLDYADERDVDLVVMGTHGRTGLERYHDLVVLAEVADDHQQLLAGHGSLPEEIRREREYRYRRRENSA